MSRFHWAIPFLSLLLLLSCTRPGMAVESDPAAPNVLIIGASSLDSPLQELVGALLESNKTPMKVERGHFAPADLDRRLQAGKTWDYIIVDAWQLTRGSTDSPQFPDAVGAFAKRVRTHSPKCQIILFSWWLPAFNATNAEVREVFRHCVEAARPNDIRVATTGPAFTEARLARPDLRITVGKHDAHPGTHGVYLNACSLFIVLTGKSPEGFPTAFKLKLRGNQQEFAIAKDEGKYLQSLAWKVYQRECKNMEVAD